MLSACGRMDGEDWRHLLCRCPSSFIPVAPDTMASQVIGITGSHWADEQRPGPRWLGPERWLEVWASWKGFGDFSSGPRSPGSPPYLRQGSALVGRSRSGRQLCAAGSVQQGAAAVRGWARPTTAARLSTRGTKKGSLEDGKGFLSEWKGKGRQPSHPQDLVYWAALPESWGPPPAILTLEAHWTPWGVINTHAPCPPQIS